MTLFKHEMKRSFVALISWSMIIAGILLISLIIYPEMGSQMDQMDEMFASMGSFTEAFGMDRVDFGSLMGYYAVECGNTLGIGGAMFAALVGIRALSKEESNHTAEFLLTHPISRGNVIVQKLLAAFAQIVVFNAIIMAVSLAGFAIIGKEVEWKQYLLVHLSFFFLQVELMLVCFGLSAFIKHGSIGIGLGLAGLMYFLNILSNISDKLEFAKYITPFKYAEPTSVIADSVLDWKLIALGLGYGVVFLCAGILYYRKKDISA